MKESLRQQDYHKVFQKRGDCIRLLAQTSGVVIFFAWFFYRSIWAVPLLFPLGILYFRRCVNRQCRKNRQELTMQFKECILSVANSLRSGYALENAFLESREDIRMLYGEHSAMYRELELIRRGMILNITLEELISDLADRSGIEEIEQFSAILNIAKRGGGNVTQIIRTTAEVISNKVETMQEMLHVSGMVLDDASPSVLGHLSKNIRIAVLKTPLVDEDVGVAASIRIVNPQSMKKQDFIKGGTATSQMLDFLSECIRYGISVCVAGATSSGKTTLLGWLLTTIPDGKRIYSIENGSRELALVRRKDGRVVNSVIHTLTRDSENERQAVDSRAPQTDQTTQSIQPKPTKPEPPSKEILTDPTQKPDGTKQDTPPVPVDHEAVEKPSEPVADPEQPQAGDTSGNQIYVPGFGWVENHGGGGSGTAAEDMYENGNKIGIMD